MKNPFWCRICSRHAADHEVIDFGDFVSVMYSFDIEAELDVDLVVRLQKGELTESETALLYTI